MRDEVLLKKRSMRTYLVAMRKAYLGLLRFFIDQNKDWSLLLFIKQWYVKISLPVNNPNYHFLLLC